MEELKEIENKSVSTIDLSRKSTKKIWTNTKRNYTS